MIPHSPTRPCNITIFKNYSKNYSKNYLPRFWKIFPLTLLGQKKIHWDKKSLLKQRGGTAEAKGGKPLLFCLFFDLNKTIKKPQTKG